MGNHLNPFYFHEENENSGIFLNHNICRLVNNSVCCDFIILLYFPVSNPQNLMKGV